MNRKLVALITAVYMATFPVSVMAEATDYSYLEDMSVKELRELDAAIRELLGDSTNEVSSEVLSEIQVEDRIVCVTDSLGTAEEKEAYISDNLDMLNEAFHNIDLSNPEWSNIAYGFLFLYNCKSEDEFLKSNFGKNWYVDIDADTAVEYNLDKVSFMGRAGNYIANFQRNENRFEYFDFHNIGLKANDWVEVIEQLYGNSYSEKKDKYGLQYTWYNPSPYIEKSHLYTRLEENGGDFYFSIRFNNYIDENNNKETEKMVKESDQTSKTGNSGTAKTYMNSFVKPFLKDPESMVIYTIKYLDASLGEMYFVDYGAKNSFGGYVRDKAVFIDGQYFTSDSTDGSIAIRLYYDQANTIS